MRKLYPIYVPLLLLLLCTCKKETKHVNSEKNFSLIFADSAKAPMNKCFDKVWAEGRAALGSCSNYQEGLKLPLSLKYDATIYYFHSKGKTDTLTIKYSRRFEPQSSEFEAMYTILELKSSFPNISQKCVSDLTPTCDGDKTYLSAVVYQ